jgi:hypothetical protein
VGRIDRNIAVLGVGGRNVAVGTYGECASHALRLGLVLRSTSKGVVLSPGAVIFHVSEDEASEIRKGLAPEVAEPSPV